MDRVTYSFQNPNTGWPMTLVERRDGRLAVIPEIHDDWGTEPSAQDWADARHYTRVAREAADIHDAAHALRSSCGAADITF